MMITDQPECNRLSLHGWNSFIRVTDEPGLMIIMIITAAAIIMTHWHIM